jgi:hypothetical protein
MQKVNSFIIIVMLFCLYSCDENKEISSVNPVNWEKRMIDYTLEDSLIHGSSYLSVYSQIYSYTEHRKHNLTSTVSMRNINRKDTIYIQKAEYFDTHGNSIRTYFDHIIYIAPMESVEIVIDEVDQEGGTGANFIFEWIVKPGSNEPLFESVMISTSGQQGLSFTSNGKRIE